MDRYQFELFQDVDIFCKGLSCELQVNRVRYKVIGNPGPVYNGAYHSLAATATPLLVYIYMCLTLIESYIFFPFVLSSILALQQTMISAPIHNLIGVSIPNLMQCNGLKPFSEELYGRTVSAIGLPRKEQRSSDIA